MYHKCEVEFLYKPKGILESPETFKEALRKFFLENGYMMEPVNCGEDEYKMFTIEPMPEMIEKKVVKIPTKK
jgi:hypothetical protein